MHFEEISVGNVMYFDVVLSKFQYYKSSHTHYRDTPWEARMNQGRT